jgi:hypothetical protein
LKRCVVKEAYQAVDISPDLQQRQCLQVLPRNLTSLPSYAESKERHHAFAISAKNVFLIFEKSKGKHYETYDAAHLSSPAAAPVLAGAAPKPNPPAIKYAESKEPPNAFATSENIRTSLSCSSSFHTCRSASACRCCPKAKPPCYHVCRLKDFTMHLQFLKIQ